MYRMSIPTMRFRCVCLCDMLVSELEERNASEKIRARTHAEPPSVAEIVVSRADILIGMHVDSQEFRSSCSRNTRHLSARARVPEPRSRRRACIELGENPRSRSIPADCSRLSGVAGSISSTGPATGAQCACYFLHMSRRVSVVAGGWTPVLQGLCSALSIRSSKCVRFAGVCHTSWHADG